MNFWNRKKDPHFSAIKMNPLIFQFKNWTLLFRKLQNWLPSFYIFQNTALFFKFQNGSLHFMNLKLNLDILQILKLTSVIFVNSSDNIPLFSNCQNEPSHFTVEKLAFYFAGFVT